MTRRLVALGVAVFVVAPAIVARPADAKVNPRVNTKHATSVVFLAERRIWKRNLPRAQSFSIRCYFNDIRGGTGVPVACTFRVYRRANFTGRLLVFPVDVSVVARRAAHDYEDGSAWITYSAGRSLYANPRAPH